MDGDEHVYGPDRYSNFLFDFIRENKDQPFFIYYPMALTHNPFPDPPPMPLDEKQHPKSHQGFARMVSYADHIVGQFNALLTELDLDKNTLILFTGDNGTNTSLTSHLGDLVIKGGKGKMTEAGTRVPLIAKWPAKVKAGTDSEKLISLVDLLPTFNAIADIPTADNVSGMDLSHYFTGKKGTDRDHIFVCYGNGYFVRTPEWRLHNTGKLFHIPVTSNERRYSEKSMEAPERQQELQKLLDRYKTAATGGSNGEQRKKKQGDKSKKKAK
jgi:arylsulfatase A